MSSDKDSAISNQLKVQDDREARNRAYLDKIDCSLEQIAQGRVVVKTMAELEAME